MELKVGKVGRIESCLQFLFCNVSWQQVGCFAMIVHLTCSLGYMLHCLKGIASNTGVNFNVTDGWTDGQTFRQLEAHRWRPEFSGMWTSQMHLCCRPLQNSTAQQTSVLSCTLWYVLCAPSPPPPKKNSSLRSLCLGDATAVFLQAWKNTSYWWWELSVFDDWLQVS